MVVESKPGWFFTRLMLVAVFRDGCIDQILVKKTEKFFLLFQ